MSVEREYEPAVNTQWGSAPHPGSSLAGPLLPAPLVAARSRASSLSRSAVYAIIVIQEKKNSADSASSALIVRFSRFRGFVVSWFRGYSRDISVIREKAILRILRIPGRSSVGNAVSSRRV